MLPPQLEIRPLTTPPRATMRVPGSKSITNRALVLAALAAGASELRGALRSDDTETMIAALRQLGFRLEVDWSTARVGVDSDFGSHGAFAAAHADLFTANSGTTMRFLTALVALGKGRYRLDGVPRMRERPIQDLLDTLRQLGVKAYSELGNGCPPVVVEADGLPGGTARIRGELSSQFLSGLLMVAPLARGDIIIELDGPLVSQPYVAMTLAMMRTFGARTETDGGWRFLVPGRQQYRAQTYDIEPDASAASYFFAAAAITGGTVTVPGLSERSLQGDVKFVNILKEMGCQIVLAENGLAVAGGALRGIDVDMNAISDTVMTLGAVACFADGPTTIRNVAHIRHKETDRVAALAAELRRVGAMVDEQADGLTIHPRPLHGAAVDTYNDHRMAMSMSLLGLRIPGIIIRDPGCVAKTYPDFFVDLEKLRNP